MAIHSGFSHSKWWFSIAMLNYQRVIGSGRTALLSSCFPYAAEFMIPTWPDSQASQPDMVGESSTLFAEAPGIHRTEKEARLPWRFHGYYMDTRWILYGYYHDAFQALLVVRQRRANHSWVQDLHAEPDQEICAWLQSSCYFTRHLTSFNPERMFFHVFSLRNITCYYLLAIIALEFLNYMPNLGPYLDLEPHNT